MPGVSVDDDTLPKKSFTPTLPAGTVRIGPAVRNKMTATTTTAMTATTLVGRGPPGILTSSGSMVTFPSDESRSRRLSARPAPT